MKQSEWLIQFLVRGGAKHLEVCAQASVALLSCLVSMESDQR